MLKKLSASLIAVIFLFSAVVAESQTLKIRKVKGRQAIVDIQNGSLTEGETVTIGNDGIDLETPGTSFSQKAGRTYKLGANFSFTNTKTDLAGAESRTTFAFLGKFGWNFKQFELGPMASFASEKQGTLVDRNITSFGGYADYNFVPNVSGTQFVYGVGGTALFGSVKNGNSNTSSTGASVGPFAKWFGLSNDHCIEAGVNYTYLKETGGVIDITTTGFEIVAGIATYF